MIRAVNSIGKAITRFFIYIPEKNMCLQHSGNWPFVICGTVWIGCYHIDRLLINFLGGIEAAFKCLGWHCSKN